MRIGYSIVLFYNFILVRVHERAVKIGDSLRVSFLRVSEIFALCTSFPEWIQSSEDVHHLRSIVNALFISWEGKYYEIQDHDLL